MRRGWTRWIALLVLVAVVGLAAWRLARREEPLPAAPLAAAPSRPKGNLIARSYFYKPPVDGTSAARLAASHRLIVLTEDDESFRDALRAAGFRGLILQYLMANEVDGPAPPPARCDPSYQPWPNNLADRRGDYCALPESAFLHNGKGQRLYYVYDDVGPERWRTGRHYYTLMNPADSSWKRLWRQRVAADVAHLGYDGLFLDNLDVTLARARFNVSNSDGVVREYPDDAAWRRALVDFLAEMLPGIQAPVWANMNGSSDDGSDWDALLPYLDGGMNEAYAVGWPGDTMDPRRWEGQQEQAEKALAQGKGFLGVAQGEREDRERMRFALASFLLVASGDQAYFRYSLSDGSSYREVWDYPEFDTDLGEPLGPRFREGDGAWRREFRCGWVRVDPSRHAAELHRDESRPGCRG